MGEQEPITYLTQQQAAGIDELLMEQIGFRIDQLMELDGLSVATAIAQVYRPNIYKRVLVVCGPGNNGGDGLVAARHLHHFGYNPCICYPTHTPKPLFECLVTQLESLSVPFISMESLPEELLNFDIIVDAIFGFSLHGNPRPPFDDLIHRLASFGGNFRGHQKCPIIVSVDIPSGWHVEDGDISGEGIKPHMLVSLTAPKLCAKRFCGPHHFLGGRFLPPSVVSKFELKLPAYPGTFMCVRIGEPTHIGEPGASPPKYTEKSVNADPFVRFQKWFDDAIASGLNEADAMALSTATKDGKPSSRMVQLKNVDRGGFVWCSNYISREGRDMSENSNASLLFYWSTLNRQVRVEGLVQKLSTEESEQYFHSHPRDIQIAPALGNQSSVISGREVVHQQYKELEEKYPEGTKINLPQCWGGYRLIPERIEFWQGDESSVHLSLFGDVHQANNNQKGAKNVLWSLKEDITLMSSWIFVSERTIRGRNQKGPGMWARVHQLFHEAQAENPDILNQRNIESLKGRFKRLNENANKWIAAYKEAAKRRSGMSQKDVEIEAHAIYEAGGSKFQDFVVFNDVMSKHPKWDLTSLHGRTRSRPENEEGDEEGSGASTKKSRTSKDVNDNDIANPENSTTETSPISRPMGKDKPKRKGNGKTTQFESEVATELRLLNLTRDTEKQLIAAKFELERQKIQMNSMKMEKKMLNTLLARDHLSPEDIEMKRRLIALLFSQN